MTHLFRSLPSGPALLLLLAGLAAGSGVARANEPPLPKSLLLNAGFEEAHVADGVQVPDEWTFARWNNQETMRASVAGIPGATGKLAVQIPACGPGAIGFSSRAQPLSGEFRYLAVNLRVKKNADCTATPWVFIAWMKGSAWIGKTDLKINVKNGGWDLVFQEIPRSEIPAGADHFSLNLAALGKPGATGSLWYDDAIVSPEKFTSVANLQPATEFGWFEEQPVKFTAADLPAEVQAVKGSVFDSRGDPVATVTVKRDTLLRDGWVWRAPSYGLYEIAFERVESNGVASLMTRSWLQRGNGQRATLTKDRHTVAVVNKGSWQVRPTQFGIDQPGGGVNHPGDEAELRLGAQVGFGFVRKWIYWGDDWTGKSSLNSAPGVYEWETLDRYLDFCKQAGYRDNLCTFWGTPKWASTHPELTDKEICVMKYSEYPPTDLKYFGDFVAAAVRRYGADIKNWEIWNEQHLPKSTCFWKGTPAEYTALLKTAYTTIKRLQPESIVWLGGMAPRRYEPFYQEFLKTDGYAYFDMYSAHGSYPEMEIARRNEAAAGVKPKPWSSSEWHAILVSGNDPMPSEAALGRRLMTDLFQQLKNGVERVVLFDLLSGNHETEALPFSLKIGEMGQSYGLFRRRPAVEPRLCAVVMHDFLARLDGRVAFLREYDLGRQKAVMLDNGGKPLLVVWNEGDSAVPLDPQLARAVTAASTASTWEGKPWTTGLLDTSALVYITAVDRAVLDALTAPATALLYPSQRQPARSGGDARVCQGPLAPAALFGTVHDEVSRQAPWIGENLVFKGLNGHTRPAGFAARFAVGAGPDGLDLAAEVTDGAHPLDQPHPAAGSEDSIQFALDAAGNGRDNDVTEFSVALTRNGPVVWKERTAFIGGDLPGNWSPAKQPVQFARAMVRQTKGGRLYQVHVDWSELYPYTFSPDKPLRFALRVNADDGRDPVGWLEWSSGLGATKNAALFGKLQAGDK